MTPINEIEAIKNLDSILSQLQDPAPCVAANQLRFASRARLSSRPLYGSSFQIMSQRVAGVSGTNKESARKQNRYLKVLL